MLLHMKRPRANPHNFRCEEELWAAAVARAAERGESVSEAIRKFLVRYTKERK